MQKFLKKCSLVAATGALVLSALMSQSAFAAKNGDSLACVVPTDKQVSGLFTQWASALATKNPDTVAALYADNGVLLATLANDPRIGRSAMRSYFVDFLKKSPTPTIDKEVIRTGCNWASYSGVYTFKLTDEQGKVSNEQARFSYVFEDIDGKWLIVSHHSSLLPERG